MNESSYPSQLQEKFVVRLPDGLRDRIKVAASEANRSMNAEIVATLEEKYPAPPTESINEIVERLNLSIRSATQSLDHDALQRWMDEVEKARVKLLKATHQHNP